MQIDILLNTLIFLSKYSVTKISTADPCILLLRYTLSQSRIWLLKRAHHLCNTYPARDSSPDISTSSHRPARSAHRFPPLPVCAPHSCQPGPPPPFFWPSTLTPPACFRPRGSTLSAVAQHHGTSSLGRKDTHAPAGPRIIAAEKDIEAHIRLFHMLCQIPITVRNHDNPTVIAVFFRTPLYH